MTRILALATLLAFVLAPVARVEAQIATTVTGLVAGPNGPIAGATITVTNAAGALVGTATSNAAGMFTATVALSAAAAAQGPFQGTVTASIGGNVLSQGMVTVTPGTTVMVEMSQAPANVPAPPAGEVRDPDATAGDAGERPRASYIGLLIGGGLGALVGAIVLAAR